MSSTSNKRAPTTATQRLKQDYLRIKKDPVPYICAEPLPSNILECGENQMRLHRTLLAGARDKFHGSRRLPGCEDAFIVWGIISHKSVDHTVKSFNEERKAPERLIFCRHVQHVGLEEGVSRVCWQPRASL
ncbi:hypothetical protein H8959_021555 [Pygathrix nigripes]